jgi:PBP1b-binding outer membrane lipoprotein LpoB
MKKILLLAGLIFLTACAAEPGSEKWCDAKTEQPKSEWTGTDVSTYAKNCILESTTIGSEKWCKNLVETPKGEWTTDEATAYAKHCVF